MKIGIVIGSVRDGRNGEAVGKWIHEYALGRNDVGVEYELVDVKSFNLPLLGIAPSKEQEIAIKEWSDTMSALDGYVFVTPEYNRGTSGAFKNALDYLKPEVANKVAGFVGYGGLGGSFAIATLRLVMAELQVATVKTMVSFSIMSDFENMSVFKPAEYHTANVNGMLNELLAWSKAMKSLR